jgi:hypothetical protein
MRSSLSPIVVLFASVVTVNGGAIYESALFNGSVGGGYTLGGQEPYLQYLGARFTIESPVHLTAIGANIEEFLSGDLFGVILTLPGPNALPSGSPFDSSTVASVVFQAPSFPTQDLTIPLNTTLRPGTYGLVFGSGQFGATGAGAMSTNDIPLQGVNLFAWNKQSLSSEPGWYDVGGLCCGFAIRFVVYGDVITAVPEPGSVILVCSAGVFVALSRCRKIGRQV